MCQNNFYACAHVFMLNRQKPALKTVWDFATKSNICRSPHAPFPRIFRRTLRHEQPQDRAASLTLTKNVNFTANTTQAFEDEGKS